MTLKDAIQATQEEYDQEVRGGDITLAEKIVQHEFREVDASGLIESIMQGSTLYPPQAQVKVWMWVMIAFRLGMRVQRKLDHPDRPTSARDHSYDHPTTLTEPHQ